MMHEFTPMNYNSVSPDGTARGVSFLSTMRGSLIVLIFIQVVCLVLFGACCKVDFVENFTNTYYMNTGVAAMMFFGFGYLMTFLKRYGMGAVGFTMLITVANIEWGILTEVGYFDIFYLVEWCHSSISVFCLTLIFNYRDFLLNYITQTTSLGNTLKLIF